MTEMKRMSISLPKDIEQAIIDLRKKVEYCKCSYAEIIRTLIVAGLNSSESEKTRREM